MGSRIAKSITEFSESEASTSVALAGILLFAIIFSAYTIIHVEYVPEWKGDAEYAHMNEVWRDMGEIKSDFDTLTVLMDTDEKAAESGASITVPFSMGGGELPVVGPIKSSGTLSVNRYKHTMLLEFGNFSIPDINCGSVTYHSDNNYYVDQIFCYENGALILEQDDAALMKMDPSLLNFKESASEMIIFVNALKIAGKPDSISGNTPGGVKITARRFEDNESYANARNFSLTIYTNYPSPWKNYLNETARKAWLTYGKDYQLSSDGATYVKFAYRSDKDLRLTIRKASLGTELVTGGENTEVKLDPGTGIPNADFHSDHTWGDFPLTVQFYDDSTAYPEIYSWNWSFGDGEWFNTTKRTERNPIHTYETKGNYSVSLTVENRAGSDTETKSNFISHEQAGVIPPIASFEAVPAFGPAPLMVSFTDTSTGNPTSWAWDLDGDGITDSTNANPTHTYTEAGDYYVSLTAGNETGSNTTAKPIHVDPPLVEPDEWYPFPDLVIGPDNNPDIIEELKYPDPYVEFPECTGGVDCTLEGYSPNYSLNHNFQKDSALSLKLDFNEGYSGLNGSPTYVTVRMVYNLQSNLPVNMTIAGKSLGSFEPGDFSSNNWYLLNRTVMVENLDDLSDLVFNLNINKNNGNNEIKIDYLAVRLSNG